MAPTSGRACSVTHDGSEPGGVNGAAKVDGALGHDEVGSAVGQRLRERRDECGEPQFAGVRREPVVRGDDDVRARQRAAGAQTVLDTANLGVHETQGLRW